MLPRERWQGKGGEGETCRDMPRPNEPPELHRETYGSCGPKRNWKSWENSNFREKMGDESDEISDSGPGSTGVASTRVP